MLWGVGGEGPHCVGVWEGGGGCVERSGCFLECCSQVLPPAFSCVLMPAAGVAAVVPASVYTGIHVVE